MTHPHSPPLITTMNQHDFDFQAEIASLNRKIERLERASPKSVLQTILASGADGYITLGDILNHGAAMVLLTWCGGVTGAGVGLIAHAADHAIPGAEIGAGCGMIIGGLVVATRTLLDFGLAGIKPPEPGMQIDEPPDEPDMGLVVEVENGYFVLLPGLARPLVLGMAKKTARMYYMPQGSELNFSQRQLGKFWGEYLPTVKDKLLAFGLLEPARNNTQKFTSDGAAWLNKVMAEQ